MRYGLFVREVSTVFFSSEYIVLFILKPEKHYTCMQL